MHLPKSQALNAKCETLHPLDRAQLVVWGALAWSLYEDLTFCMLMTTCAFVAFNKVCTAQYFVWVFMLLPLCIPCEPRP